VSRVRGFARFCYDFVVGDDWTVALGVVVALAVTAVLARTGVPAWWAMPAAVAVVLAGSVRRAVRRLPCGQSRPAVTVSRRRNGRRP
jgi:hypothetical protein